MSDAPPAVLPVPDAASDPGRAAREPATRCLNCGAALPGAFCAACGQKAEPVRQPLGRVLADSFADFWGLDGRLWRSVGGLLFRPGHLTRAFVEGKRTRYLRPFRLYATATLAFFFLLSVFDPAGRIEREISALAPDTLVTVAAALARVDAALDPSRAATTADAGPPADMPEPLEGSEALAYALDSGRVALEFDPAVAPTGADSAAALRTERQRLVVQRTLLAALPSDSLVHPAAFERAAYAVHPDAAVDLDVPSWLGQSTVLEEWQAASSQRERIGVGIAFFGAAVDKVPTMMFVLLPLFALLLKLLYVRRDWYYAEHLVFALHTHAFAFFVFATVVGLVVASDGARWATDAGIALTGVGIPTYFVVAQKRVYGQTWGKTLGKAVVLAVLYNVVLAGGLVGAVVLAARG